MDTPRPAAICGQCNDSFDSEEAYLDHVCPKSGFTPRDPENLGEEFVAVSNAALQRGTARQDLEDQGVHPEEAKKQTADLGSEVK